MYYDFAVMSNYLLIYLRLLYVFIEFLVLYYERIARPCHDPFGYNYALILFMTLFILINVDYSLIMGLSSS